MPLPPDFRDRPHRWFWNIMVALRIRPVKQVCCESFRKEGKMRACKGCATLYSPDSSSLFYRTLFRFARKRPIQ